MRIFVAISVVVGIIVLVIAGNTIVDKAIRASDGGDRMQIWRASLQAIRMSLWLGWGLGSFADIYAIVQPMNLPIPNDLAHSTPLETMVEVGVPMALVGFAIVADPMGRVVLRGADAAAGAPLPARGGLRRRGRADPSFGCRFQPADAGDRLRRQRPSGHGLGASIWPQGKIAWRLYAMGIVQLYSLWVQRVCLGCTDRSR